MHRVRAGGHSDISSRGIHSQGHNKVPCCQIPTTLFHLRYFAIPLISATPTPGRTTPRRQQTNPAGSPGSGAEGVYCELCTTTSFPIAVLRVHTETRCIGVRAGGHSDISSRGIRFPGATTNGWGPCFFARGAGPTFTTFSTCDTLPYRYILSYTPLPRPHSTPRRQQTNPRQVPPESGAEGAHYELCATNFFACSTSRLSQTVNSPLNRLPFPARNERIRDCSLRRPRHEGRRDRGRRGAGELPVMYYNGVFAVAALRYNAGQFFLSFNPAVTTSLRSKFERVVRAPDEVIAYHGCHSDTADRVLAGEPFVLSSNPYDWLGTGIYFWEYGPDRAWDWAEKRSATEWQR